MINQAPQTQKLVDQLIALNKVYTPDSFAVLTKTIDAPTLILWGKQDKIINVEVANELKRLLKCPASSYLRKRRPYANFEAEQLVIQQYVPFY